jgi:aminoglycoside phosphotransferase (APT) family kinase protein
MADPAPLDFGAFLDPAWLTGALGVEVTAAREVDRQETIASKVRFEVSYGEPTDLPAALCVKGYFREDSRQWASLGAKEARFYTDLAPTLPVEVPRCVYTGVSPETGHGIVVMEDLVAAGATFLTALSPYGPDQVAATLDQLAALHASNWDSAALAAESWLAPAFVGYADVISDVELDGMLAGPRGEPIPPAIRQASRLKAALGALAARYEARPRALVHADAHAGNLYEPAGGGAGLVDWQVYQYSHWSMDVAYHVGAVLEPEVRSASERDLVAHYLDRLAAHGVTGPPFDEAWADYRASLAYGYFMWAITRRVEERIMLEFNRRLGLAVAEHGSLDLLAV